MVPTPSLLSIEILPEELLIDDFKIAKKVDAIYHNREKYDTLFTEVKNMQTKEFLVENIIQKYIDLYKRILGDDS